MQRLQLIVAAALLAFAGTGVAAMAAPTAAPSPAASTAPTPTPDPAMVARAKSFFKMLQTGQLDKSQLSAEALTSLTPDKLAAAKAALAPLGDPVTFEQVATGVKGTLSYYVYLLSFGNGAKLNYVFALDAQSKVAGLQVAPAQSSP